MKPNDPNKLEKAKDPKELKEGIERGNELLKKLGDNRAREKQIQAEKVNERKKKIEEAERKK